MSKTLAVIRRVRMSYAVTWLASAAVCAVITSRYVVTPPT